MIEIAITIVISFFCFCAFIFLFARPREQFSERDLDTHVAGLNAVHFSDFDILSGYRDYQVLLLRPELKSVRVKFRQDRRRIMLIWLKELQRDLQVIWQFRRFLVKNGLPITFRDELTVGFAAVASLFYVRIMRLTVFILGPFKPHRALRKTRTPIERLSVHSFALLARAPHETRAKIEEAWAKHLVALRAA